MARDEAAPFARGETYYNGGPIDTTNLGGQNLEGKEFVFEVNSQDQGTGYPAGQDASGRPIRVKVVRNNSSINLKPARLARYDVTQALETKVDGYCYQLSDRPAGVVDEFLPAAGVPPQDLFYVVVEGPSQVTNQATPITTAVGGKLVPATTGANQADDLAGRVALQDLTGTAATLGNNIQHRVGYADAVNSTANAKFAAVISRRPG